MGTGGGVGQRRSPGENAIESYPYNAHFSDKSGYTEMQVLGKKPDLLACWNSFTSDPESSQAFNQCALPDI